MTLKKKTQVGIVIGRMNPPHKGHKHLISNALNNSDLVIVVLGSAFQARTPKNPFKAPEREQLVRAMFSAEENERIAFVYVRDYKYSDSDWVAAVRSSVNKAIRVARTDASDYQITLFSYVKDASTRYVKWFPEWKERNVDAFFLHGKMVNATDLRDHIFINLNFWMNPSSDRFVEATFVIGHEVREAISHIIKTNVAVFERLRDWHIHHKTYKTEWGEGPFMTGDPVVFCNSYVLLVRRGGVAGKGLLALPGGHLGKDERIVDCIFRELKEETKINVPPGKLRNSLKRVELFDAVDRSERARVITHAGIIVLEDEETLPRVKGSDDAAEAMWVPFEKLPYLEEEFFEDHWHIIQTCRGLMKTS